MQYLIHYMLGLKYMETALFYVSYVPVLFQQSNFGRTFSQIIHRFKIGIFCVDLRLYFQVFPN